MKFNILKPALAALVLVGTACTANYLDINTNPYEPSEDDMQTDGYIIGSALTSLASTVVSTDVNTAQFTDVLLGGPMGGYYSTTGGFTRTIMNYNPTDDWTNVFMYSDRTIPVLYSNLRELKKVTDDADRCNAVIHLEVVPSGPLNAAALQEWYERNGFFRVAPSPTERSSAIKMWRPPNPYGERLLRSGKTGSES
jgi:hypothetical protein